MNKAVIIGGSIALLGVGAYVYFKTKSKDETPLTTTGTGTTGAGTTGAGTETPALPSGTTLPTPEAVEAEVEKIKKAKDLALSICRLRIMEKKSSSIKFKSAIVRDTKRLKLLGYTEVNCEIVKIV
jgi:hypothetical protein